MLESIHIDNFRGFQHLSLTGARPLNLIVGRNNSGKSSLLEAICLAGSGPNPDGAVRIASLRGEEFDGKGVDRMWRPFFRAMDSNIPVSISFKLASEVGERSLTIEAMPEKGFRSGQNSGEFAAQSTTRSRENIGGLLFKYTLPDGTIKRLESEYEAARGRLEKFPSDPETTLDVRIESSALPSLPGLYKERYSALKLKANHHTVLLALRNLEPQLEDIEVVAEHGGVYLYAKLESGTAIPASHMGEGFLRLFQIATALSTAPVGALFLIDELGAGIHHSVHTFFWEFLADVANVRGVQVFATTHNDEIIRAALSNERVRSTGFGLFRIDRKEMGHRVTAYNEDAMDGALEFNMEVRA